MLLWAVLLSLSILFLYCYFGKVATDSYGKMADCLYEINWYEHPIELQKCLIIMITNAQKPLQYRGLSATLDLETFCEVSCLKLAKVQKDVIYFKPFISFSLVYSIGLYLLHDFWNSDFRRMSTVNWEILYNT